jgi:uncharacterized protein
MPALPRCLKCRRAWLVLAGLVLVFTLDTFRAPPRQVTARAYVGAVQVYQRLGRPMIRDRVVCRFYPCCSDYSIEAVQRHGIRRGLVLTAKRLATCNQATPLGTYDPVPPGDEEPLATTRPWSRARRWPAGPTRPPDAVPAPSP